MSASSACTRFVRFDYGKDGLMARGPAHRRAAGHEEAPVQQRDRGARLRSEGRAARRQLARIFRAGPRRRRQPASPSSSEGPVPAASPSGVQTTSTSATQHYCRRAICSCSSASFPSSRACAIRIRRIPLAGVQPGALVDGPALFEADMGYQIDNMEGLAVHRTAAGETVLTLISDDNFSPISAHGAAAVHADRSDEAARLRGGASRPRAFLLICRLSSTHLRRELVVLRLQQEGVEPAAMVHRLERVGGYPQPHRAAQRVRQQRDVAADWAETAAWS